MQSRATPHLFLPLVAVLSGTFFGCGGDDASDSNAQEASTAGSAGASSAGDPNGDSAGSAGSGGIGSADTATDTAGSAGLVDAAGAAGTANGAAGSSGVSAECVETCVPIAAMCMGIYTQEDCETTCSNIEAQATEQEVAEVRACLAVATTCLQVIPCVANY